MRMASENKNIQRALEFATRAHEGQLRKGTDLPYITHPVAAAKILQTANCREEIIIAALLHDVLEDTDCRLEDIVREFGDDVASIVLAASEPEAIVDGAGRDDKKESWQSRKSHTVEFLKSAPLDAALVSLADKLHNIRSISADFCSLGDDLWSRFNRPREQQEWYYRELLNSFRHRFRDTEYIGLVEEFAAEVAAIFGRH